MKALEFIDSSLHALSSFPVEVRRAVGHELWQVQNELMPSDFKPMPEVGPGAYEIRVHALAVPADRSVNHAQGKSHQIQW